MALPKEFRTPRFETLPKDLKARAEAIIKKKFGIEAKKPIKRVTKNDFKKLYDDMVNTQLDPPYIQDYPRYDPRYNALDFGNTGANQLKPIISWSIYREAGFNGIVIELQCKRCGTRRKTLVADGFLYDSRTPYFEITFSCACGTDRQSIYIGDLMRY